MNAGQIVRSARKAVNMTLAELGDHCGYSAAQISRYERGLTRLTDVALLRRFADVLGIPPVELGLSGRSGTPEAAESPDTRLSLSASRSVAVTSGKEDPVRRRDLLLGTGLAAPTVLLARVDSALAVMPAPAGRASAAAVATWLSRARAQFDEGRLTQLVSGIPSLLSAGHDLLDQAPDDERHMALLARCYHLACEGLHKSGSAQAARITADRAATYAGLSGDPAAEAMAARSTAVVLRHEGRQDLAASVTRAAADRLAGTGLRAAGTANALAQILCTGAYSAAQAGERDEAAVMIAEVRDIVRRVPSAAARDVACTTVTPEQVSLYEVGIWWSLGEPGAALNAARGLRPAQFPTPERRARMFTDLARVWEAAGKPERAIAALLGRSEEQ